MAPNGQPQQGAASAPQGQGPGQPGAPNDQPVKKETPVYKKWWFWAVVAVSAYVVYSIATEDSRSTANARILDMPQPTRDGGDHLPALFRF